MGKMILCRGKQTDKPLVIEGTGMRLYTAEELCYYIYNNIYLIGQDFINGRLIEFLRQTGEEDLSERVRSLYEKKAGLAEILVTILLLIIILFLILKRYGKHLILLADRTCVKD